MAGASECLWGGGGVCQSPDGGCAVCGRDTSGTSFQFIHGDGERRAQHGGVFHHLVGQVKFFATCFRDGGAEQSARIFQHEIHHFSGNGFCCADEIAFVFAVLIIHDDDELTFSEVFYGFVDAVEFNNFHYYIPYLYIKC